MRTREDVMGAGPRFGRSFNADFQLKRRTAGLVRDVFLVLDTALLRRAAAGVSVELTTSMSYML